MIITHYKEYTYTPNDRREPTSVVKCVGHYTPGKTTRENFHWRVVRPDYVNPPYEKLTPSMVGEDAQDYGFDLLPSSCISEFHIDTYEDTFFYYCSTPSQPKKGTTVSKPTIFDATKQSVLTGVEIAAADAIGSTITKLAAKLLGEKADAVLQHPLGEAGMKLVLSLALMELNEVMNLGVPSEQLRKFCGHQVSAVTLDVVRPMLPDLVEAAKMLKISFTPAPVEHHEDSK